MTYDPRRRSTLTRINSIQADRVQEFHTKIRKLNYYAKWIFDSLLHTPRIVGNERISRQRIVKNFFWSLWIFPSTAVVASYLDPRSRPLVNYVNRIFCINQRPNWRPKWSMKNPDDLRPPLSIYSHSYKFLRPPISHRISTLAVVR